jgi:hypothetical protein
VTVETKRFVLLAFKGIVQNVADLQLHNILAKNCGKKLKEIFFFSQKIEGISVASL